MNQSLNELNCRICTNARLTPILSLGMHPLANSLIKKENLDQPEETYSLELALCQECSTVQIMETADPNELFSDYPYFSSFSNTMLEHSRSSALRLVESRRLNADSLVVEIASNDGYMLKSFVDAGVPVLGIEPSVLAAEVAIEKGVPTIARFFNAQVAKELRAEGRAADVMLANNVFAHVPDINGFVEGFKIMLKEDGLIVIETPYLKNLIDECKFDTIYQEHIFYYSFTTMDYLLNQHGLCVIDVEQIDIHGGSLRVFATHKERAGTPSEAVQKMLANEQQWVRDMDYFNAFAEQIERLKVITRDTLYGLKMQGRTLAAYGAAAKGSTFINTFNLGTDVFDFVVDRSIYKQGLYMPGKHLPIYPTEYLLEAMPDYLVIFAWNFAPEITAQQSEYRRRGGRFITAIPELRIF